MTAERKTAGELRNWGEGSLIDRIEKDLIFYGNKRYNDGFEEGVRKSAELVMVGHMEGDRFASTARCDHMDNRDRILSLLKKEEKK